MARGMKDYGMYAATATIARLADMGEMAARLGSIVTFDRRGDIVFMDSFEDQAGLSAWATMAVGTGASVAQDTTIARMKGCSCKLVTGNTPLDYSQIITSRAIAVIGKLGLEVSFTGPGTDERFYMSLTHYTGAKAIVLQIRYDGDGKNIYIQKADGSYQALAMTYPLYVGTRVFHTIKLVGDFSTEMWVRLLLDNLSFSVTDYGLYVPASAVRPVMVANIQFLTLAAANKTRYADDVIVTQNEP